MALRWFGIAAAGALAVFLVVVGIALITQVDVPRTELPRDTVTHTARTHDHPRHGARTPHHRARP